MSDAIGAAIIVGALLIPRTTGSSRTFIALVLFIASWMCAIDWEPVEHSEQILKRFLVGDHPGFESPTFPVLPWCALFLVGTTAGPWIRASVQKGDNAGLAYKVLAIGTASILMAACAKGIYLAARPLHWVSLTAMPPHWLHLYLLTTPFAKYPPGPTYMLMFAGTGLVLAGSCLWLSARRLALPVLRWGAVLGRASLFVYVLQFYIFFLVVPRLSLQSIWSLPIWFALCTLLLWLAALGWNRWIGNRVLTLGLAKVPADSARTLRKTGSLDR